MTIVTDESIIQTIEGFKKLDEKICNYSSILSLVNWDSRTGAPKKGKAHFAKAKGTLSTEVFNLSISNEMGEYLELLSKPEVEQKLDEDTKACVRERKKVYDKSKRVPSELYNEYVVTISNAIDAWEEAREKDDFKLFQPHLEKIVTYKREFTEYYGYEGNPYNTLLDDFEPGLTVEAIDPLFTDLRKKSIALLDRIQSSTNQPRKDIFKRKYPVEIQQQFNRFLLPKLGFDLDAGRLDVTVHPFATGINTGDVRITTRYDENNVRMAIFGTIHETGHGIYEQGINPDYEGTVLRRGASFGIHESQSRFLENMVGRSRAFWKYFFNDLQSHFTSQLADVSHEEFYKAINIVEPSLIRVEADELTYNLHIMLRYEIEKGLIAGEIAVKDLPEIWNSKLQDYLGITASNNKLGVLQDVHWSQGSFGYFPSYSLGNLYAAQILNTIKQQIPNFYESIQMGEFQKIKEWLGENIHQYGKRYTPNELLQKVTGEPLNAQYLIDYFEEKYTDVYGI